MSWQQTRHMLIHHILLYLIIPEVFASWHKFYMVCFIFVFQFQCSYYVWQIWSPHKMWVHIHFQHLLFGIYLILFIGDKYCYLWEYWLLEILWLAWEIIVCVHGCDPIACSSDGLCYHSLTVFVCLQGRQFCEDESGQHRWGAWVCPGLHGEA